MNTTPNPLPKKWRVAERLLRGWLTCREAPAEVGDHVLHSTISELQNRHQLIIERQPVVERGYGGEPVRLLKYRIPKSQAGKVAGLVAAATKDAACGV